MVGELAAIGSAFCWAASSVLLKAPSRRLRAFYITAFRLVFTALLVIATAAIAGQLGDVIHIPLKGVLILVVSGAIVITGDIAFFRAFATDDLSRVFTVTTGLYILMSVVASIVIAGDANSGVVAGALSSSQVSQWLVMVVGGVLVVLGISLISEPGRGKVGGIVRRGVSPVGLGLSAFTAVTWTVGLLALNEGMKYADPLPAAALRLPVMALVLAPFAVVTGDFARYRTGGRDKLALVVSGLLGGGSAMLFMTSVKYAAPGVVAILSSASPVFVLAMSALLLKVRPTRRSLVGTAVCMAGIVLTV
ncbi:MAG: DMT family transporter [Chloroflexota bacterium]|nr:DMT family transporter [Chloroflexota bacterium]